MKCTTKQYWAHRWWSQRAINPRQLCANLKSHTQFRYCAKVCTTYWDQVSLTHPQCKTWLWTCSIENVWKITVRYLWGHISHTSYHTTCFHVLQTRKCSLDVRVINTLLIMLWEITHLLLYIVTYVSQPRPPGFPCVIYTRIAWGTRLHVCSTCENTATDLIFPNTGE